jgi:hypothetical protein
MVIRERQPVILSGPSWTERKGLPRGERKPIMGAQTCVNDEAAGVRALAWEHGLAPHCIWPPPPLSSQSCPWPLSPAASSQLPHLPLCRLGGVGGLAWLFSFLHPSPPCLSFPPTPPHLSSPLLGGGGGSVYLSICLPNTCISTTYIYINLYML